MEGGGEGGGGRGAGSGGGDGAEEVEAGSQVRPREGSQHILEIPEGKFGALEEMGAGCTMGEEASAVGERTPADVSCAC